MPKSSNDVVSRSGISEGLALHEESLLWELIQKGDYDSFGELLAHYYPLLLNYGERINSDREFVKDCLHDLFVDIWNRRDNLNKVQNIKSYLLASLRRRVIKEANRLKWFRNAAEIDDNYHFEVQFAIENYLIKNEIKHRDLKLLKYNLEKLTKRQREVIYLRFYQEMEYEEIAQIMEINNHSAVNLIYEALKLLRKNWFLTITLVTNFLL